MRIPTPKIEIICLVGDHHGTYGVVEAAIKRSRLTKTLFIHVGDGGEAGKQFPETLRELNKNLKRKGNHYWSIRGNHSDPAFFTGEQMLSNVKLLPDYSRATLFDKEWLFVGGAISIDRVSLTIEHNWWPGEEFTPPPNDLDPCDILVTHSGPKMVTPPTKGPLVQHYEDREIEICGKSGLWEDLQKEHREHERLFELVRPSKWFLGHFHTSLQLNHEGCLIRVLDVQEILQFNQYA